MTFVIGKPGSIALPGSVVGTEPDGMRRMAPVIALFFIAPFVAEYLLGDLPITLLFGMVALAPLYGGGALLIREAVRRTGRGWPSILVLALAYGLVEEGLLTQSLFNPDYFHAHLLDRGFVPALGIAVPWTIFVLTLHVVWSIGSPIALAEALVPARATQPWLRTKGMVVSAIMFLAGSAFTIISSYADGHFIAPWPRLATAGVLAAVLVVVALRLPRTDGTARHPRSGRAPAAWLTFGGALAAGMAFMLVDELLDGWWWWTICLAALAILAAVIVGVSAASRREGWGLRQHVALAAGALLTYAIRAFFAPPLQEGLTQAVVLTSHVTFAAIAVVLIIVAAVRAGRASRAQAAAPDDPQPPAAQLSGERHEVVGG